jgi:trimeric autotransporter adhesin
MNFRINVAWLQAAGVCVLLSGCGDDGQTVDSTGIDRAPATGVNGGSNSNFPGRANFSVSSLKVNEGSGQATVTVTRSESAHGVLTVAVNSRNGSAIEPDDYTALSAEISFADGDSAPKTVTVPIIDDSVDEADKTFYLTLSSATQGSVGAASEILLTIIDDDMSAPAAPKAVMSSTYKHLHVDWTAVPNATSYRLLKDANGSGTYAQIGADLPASARNLDFEVSMAQEEWTRARYVIAACNSAGCTNSNSMNLAGLSAPMVGYLKNSEARPSEGFGTSVAISADGNTLAVGAADGGATAASRTGAVSIFLRTANSWSFVAKLVPANGDDFDQFGRSVALSADGSTLAVGAPQEASASTNPADNTAPAAGAVYVFRQNTNGWEQLAYLKAATPQQYANFGGSLALSADGNVIGIGAPDQTIGTGFAHGAAYVFTRSGANWIQQSALTAPVQMASAYFGISIATNASGSLVAVGAYGEDIGALNFAGRVHLYTRALNTWSYQNSVSAATPSNGAQFGAALALDSSGTTLAVSASTEDSLPDPTQKYVGAVHVFGLNGTTPNFIARLVPSNAEDSDWFGTALALSNDGHTIAATSIYEDGDASGIDGVSTALSAYAAGAAYVFSNTLGTWTQHAYVKASNTEANDSFGAAIALDATGNTLVVTAPNEQSAASGFNGNQSDDCESSATHCAEGSGAVYVY